MPKSLLDPTDDEVRTYLVHVIQHVCLVEFVLNELGIGKNDPERPHDIVGQGNKFEWEVIRGFALQYRNRSPEHFRAQVQPSLIRHRLQYHHRKWNEPNDLATPDDMKLGAVDAICSLLEPRDYQGGRHTFERILEVVARNPPHKRPWMLEMVPKIQKLKLPALHRISLDDIPNVGIPGSIHRVMIQRVTETRAWLMAARGMDA